MNKQDIMKEFVNNYHFPYSTEELNKFAMIFGKIIKIMYGNENINILDKNDINYLKEKKLIEEIVGNLIIVYISHVNSGAILKDDTKAKLYKMLEGVVINLRKIDEEWQQAKICDKLLQNGTNINDLNEKELTILVNMIVNSYINEIDKEDLLMNLSLDLCRETK